MANCLVLGGNGLIGSFVSEKLVQEGHKVRVFDVFSGKDNLKEIESSIEKIKGDYLKAGDVKAALSGMEFVFHCIHTTVPRTSIERPVFDAETNILPAISFLRDSIEEGVKKIVFLSSMAVYGNPAKNPVKEDAQLEPVTPYGVSKRAIERYIEYFNRLYGLDYSILRPATAYGERQAVSLGTGVVANFIFNALRDEPLVIYGDGNAERDLLHAQDLAAGAVLAAFKKTKFKIFNLGTGKGITLNQLAKKVESAKGGKLMIKHLDKIDQVEKLVCDSSRAKKELGWKAEISLDEGIKRCVEAFKKQLKK